ncbi:MAG: PilN domain-containing protein [Phycisphaerae bacterium]|nr:PilN domain-containing protein [Phycisphaerae bacterium]
MQLPNFLSQQSSSGGGRSFLPEDYLRRRAERRTNVVALSLFSVVTVMVVGAFLVTNRQWHDVKRYQEAINVRYAQAAKDIEQLKVLEEQKRALLQKAELTTALIERVPKTVLLAELTNRMPTDVTLLELELKSTRIKDAPKVEVKKEVKGKKPTPGKAARTAKGDDQEVKAVVTPPRFISKLAITGVTGSHNSVAEYVTALQACALITSVELKFSEKAVIEEQEMNRFRIEAELKPEADTRRMQPLAMPRNQGDAFNMKSKSTTPDPTVSAPVGAEGSEP